jgi:hypothetical protein
MATNRKFAAIFFVIFMTAVGLTGGQLPAFAFLLGEATLPTYLEVSRYGDQNRRENKRRQSHRRAK